MNSIFTAETLRSLESRFMPEIGVRVAYSESLVEQHRKPKSKKARIQKKWRRNPDNWRPIRNAFKVGNMLRGSPGL
jgi:hypothetical protein